MIKPCLLFILSLLVAACGSRAALLQEAYEAGFAESTFAGEYFDLRELARGKGPAVHVYIEGDGKAWLNQRTPSPDPTPDNPVGLSLALADPSAPVAYLARPCQFVEGDQRRNCSVPLWTSARFADSIVQDMSLALDDLKTKTDSRRVVLIGYSGGGAIALLLAAIRNDVDAVVTVAGNLDHAFWTRLHRVSPLRDSLNPKDFAETLQSVKQVHVVSSDDENIPRSVAQSYVDGMSDKSNVRIITVNGLGHNDNWAAVIPELLKQNGVW